ncbi:MAG: hypothetical protein Q9161_009546 [Pseudevernia consocians]
MSFGFSVSDIYGCACLAYRLYDEFQQAPGACKEFALELLLFHGVLMRTKSSLEYETSHLSHSDQAALEACLDSCKELLYVQISGAPKVPENLDMIKFSTQDLRKNDFSHPSSDHARFLRGLRQKVRERNFALRIPKFQRAISAHVQKLNALSVLIIQSYQIGIQATQERIAQSVAESHDLLVISSTDYAVQLDSLSARLETSQTRIEAKLQTILANQQKSKSPIMSHSLNASSPEGRQTWMELGRLLRDEGITPALIQRNRGLLVNAMKTTLEDQTFSAESIPESYATAPEYRIDNITSSSVTQPRNASTLGFPSVLSSISILGSAPPPSAGFTDLFLERQNNAASSLDQKENVDDGMRSLLQGMSREELDEGYQQDDIDDVELGDDKETGKLEETPYVRKVFNPVP